MDFPDNYDQLSSIEKSGSSLNCGAASGIEIPAKKR
jgi:hypothetical protein